MLEKLKKYYAGLRSMSRPTYDFLKYYIIASCIILAFSLLVFVYAGDFSPRTYKLYHLGKSLYDAPAGILAVAAVGSVCIEDIIGKK